MSSKGTILSLVLSVNLIVFLFLPQKAYSQACGQVVIDSYTCDPNPDPETGVCAPPYRTGSTLYLPCSIQGNSCQSSFGYCSSRDSCVNVGGTCNCTAQRVDCNTGGNLERAGKSFLYVIIGKYNNARYAIPSRQHCA